MRADAQSAHHVFQCSGVNQPQETSCRDAIFKGILKIAIPYILRDTLTRTLPAFPPPFSLHFYILFRCPPLASRLGKMGLSSSLKGFKNGKRNDAKITSPRPTYQDKPVQSDAAAVAERRQSATGDGRHADDMRDPTTRLHRGLQARQVTMIAIGGAIGTGLIIGTGASLAKAGPLSILISYSIVGFIVYMVMCALGEMATWLPLESGFTGYATRFCDPALGFSLGYTYWFKYIIVTPNQLTAAALVISYWVDRETVNPGVWIAIFLVVILLINYLGIKIFGELEFWLSSIKVATICGLILLCLILFLGGGPDHDRKGFRYWKSPGAMKPLYASK